ncbi:MAG: hypothetical protein V1777_04040 [Candidatus Micrarchaeota archaeon]
MEQTVWLYFGVIAVLIGLLAVTQLISFNTERDKQMTMESSLNQLANFCDFTCLSDVNQFLSQSVPLASGSSVYSTDLNALCYSYSQKQQCRQCKCPIWDSNSFPATRKNFRMDLTSETIRSLYSTHTFSCSFLRQREGVTLACTG